MEENFNDIHISNASFWARCAAWFIDIAIFTAVFYGLVFLFSDRDGDFFIGLFFFITFLFWGGYFGFYDSNGRQTFGKKLLNIQTILQDGSDLTFSRASIRGFLKLFLCGPNLFGVLNLIYMAINKDDLMIQDRLAKTRVINITEREKPK